MKKEVDVLVIGAGPSGTIAAAILQQEGIEVAIVEKTQFPRFVIGESFLPRCMAALDAAGMIGVVKEQCFQQKNGAKFVYNNEVCDFDFSWQLTTGWNWTWQVPRADFDKVLADECERRGIPVYYQTEVTNVSIHEDGTSDTTVKTADGTTETIRAKFIIDGSGYGRVLPTLFGLNKPSTQLTRKAVFCHVTDPLRSEAVEPDRITIYVHNPDTWIWVIPFSNGNTSVGYVGKPEFFEAFTGTLEEQYRALLAAEPDLAKRFKNADLVWETPKVLQGWSSTTDTFYGKGFALTGNVTEFLDPVFSSGVTLAAVSAEQAARLVAKQLKGVQIDWETDYADMMRKGIDVFRTFVNAWYDGDLFKIFFAKNPDPGIMAQICSVLAGYVWDESNPAVRNHKKMVRTLSRYLSATESSV